MVTILQNISLSCSTKVNDNIFIFGYTISLRGSEK